MHSIEGGGEEGGGGGRLKCLGKGSTANLTLPEMRSQDTFAAQMPSLLCDNGEKFHCVCLV